MTTGAIRLALTFLLGGALVGAQPGRGQTCDFDPGRTPAKGVPQALWGELQPVDTGTLPAERDNTEWDEFGSTRRSDTQLWTAVDVEGGWVFTAFSHGLQIWDARGASASSPSLVTTTGRTGFLVWSGNPHDEEPVRDIDAPSGNSNIVAVAVTGGLNVFDASTKSGPKANYADGGKTINSVYAGRVSAKSYAVAATAINGALVYDLDVAAGLNQCADTTPTSATCGPYLGRLGDRASVKYVDGTSSPTGDRLFVAFGGGEKGLDIWDISNPVFPTPLITDALPNDFLNGLALWNSGSSYYLAVRIGVSEARIYDVSCIGSQSCAGLGSLLWSQGGFPSASSVGELTFSKSSGRPFLYMSAFHFCPSGVTQEFLFDVSDPRNPVEMTPPAKDVNSDGIPDGYWGYYYRGNPTGFNHVRPRGGKFGGQYFYRVAYGIFDIHSLATPTPPTADFTYQPTTVYATQPIDFLDASTAGPTSWFWQFEGATPAQSTAQSPQDVVFAAPGSKTVTLTASNALGAGAPKSKVLQVLDPAPSVTGVGVSPQSPIQCQPVTLAAQGANGLPPLTYSWQLLDASQAPALGFASQNTANVVWNSAGAPAGSYAASVTVSGAGPAAQAQTSFSLGALSPLPADGSFAPTNDPFTQGTVQFHVAAAGATEYCWSFGDGKDFPTGCTTGAAWSTDPVAGPNPTHSYTQIGTYAVTVQVRNCVDTTARTSAALSVDVTSVQPLIASFAAQGICSGFGSPGVPRCSAGVGEPITFLDGTQGNPDTYEYDWVGDGVYEQSSSTPVTSHTYTTVSPQGEPFRPALRVRRGAETHVFQHEAIQIGTATPKSISISGPSSGAPNQSLGFTASASGCTPSDSSWTWSVTGGGVITGSGKSVTIRWTTTGTKSISVTSSACFGTTGTKAVSILTSPPPPPPPPPGGGGTLTASFTFTPASPQAGQAVTFTSTSVGASNLTWEFGDGGTANGTPVKHTYAVAGSYTVKLIASKQDPNCLPFGFCEEQTTKVVTVGGDPVLSAAISADVQCSAGICFIDTGQVVTLRDVSSGEVTSRSWDLGDGTVSTDEVFTHVWRRPGSYTVSLTVSDGEDTSEASLVFAVGGDPLGGAETTMGVAPAATLLFPYFSVDLGLPAGETTLIGVTNTAPEARLVQVTLWTNWGIPSVSFPVYLSGYDVYSLNLRDVFNGQLPVTGPVSSNRALDDFPEKAFPACGGEQSDVPQPSINPDHLRAWHLGEPSPENGLCASAPGVPGVAVGYVTVDVVEQCSFSSPADEGYFAADGSGIASNENVLLGDFFLVDSSDDSAQAELAVHIRAGEEFFSDGDYTFYGRYVDGDGSDKRQPLASVFETHYLSGGAFTGGTRLLVWRDTKSPLAEPIDCGGVPAWGPLPESQLVIFDEGGKITFDGSGERFPWATQRVDVGETIPIAAPAGRVQIDLNHGQSELFGEAAQAYVLSTFSALGRFSVDLQAKALATVSSEVAAEISSASATSDLAPKRVQAETFDASTFSRACDVGTVPAATLLFPYFEVDLATGGLDTLISFENTAAEPRLTQVTLWTDWGVPSLSFNVYLSGFDTQTLSMRDVLNGHLPHTGPVTSSRDIETVPEVGFPGCGGSFVDVPIPFVDAAQLAAFHTGRPAPPTGQCFGTEREQGRAVGFLTVDVVNRCSLLRPSDNDYFEHGGQGVASNDNVLVGDFFLVNAAQNSAQGNAAVHLIADSSSFGPGDYTFYGRFVNGNGADNRQPLGSVYATRYLQGGAFDGGTWLIIWRDSKSPEVSPVACGQEPSWSPLDKPRIEVMNEAGLVTFSGRRGGYNAMTQLVGAGGVKLPIEDPFGHLVLDLNHEGTGLFGGSAQAWVGVIYTAEGRFSTAGSAHVLGRVCGSP